MLREESRKVHVIHTKIRESCSELVRNMPLADKQKLSFLSLSEFTNTLMGQFLHWYNINGYTGTVARYTRTRVH